MGNGYQTVEQVGQSGRVSGYLEILDAFGEKAKLNKRCKREKLQPG